MSRSFMHEQTRPRTEYSWLLQECFSCSETKVAERASYFYYSLKVSLKRVKMQKVITVETVEGLITWHLGRPIINGWWKPRQGYAANHPNRNRVNIAKSPHVPTMIIRFWDMFVDG